MEDKSHYDPLINILYDNPNAKHFKLIPDNRFSTGKTISHSEATENVSIENVSIENEKVKNVFLFRAITMDMEMMVQIPKENRDLLIKANLAANAGFKLLRKDQNEAIKQLREAVDLYNLAGGYGVKGDILNDIGLAYSWVHMYEEGLHYFSLALEIFENVDWERYVSVLINRASLYEESNKWTKAIEDLNSANWIADKNNFSKQQVLILNNTAYILYCHQEFKDALEKYEKVISIKSKHNYSGTSLAQTYFNIAVIQEDIRQIKDAINSYKECLELLEFKFDEKKSGEAIFQIANIDAIRNLQHLIKDHIGFLEGNV